MATDAFITAKMLSRRVVGVDSSTRIDDWVVGCCEPGREVVAGGAAKGFALLVWLPWAWP